MREGKVYLVGAGPGDPGLITVKGLRCIQQAEVLLYDSLANPALLEGAPEGCEKIFVGKRAGFQALSQDETHALLLERAQAGRTVVRLKGGDPFVFGRGGEEAEALREAGVAFEVVPGITSAIAAPAYAGIPVTHRGLSTHVTVVTGHEDPSKGRTDVDWEALARAGGTLVILMGAGNRGTIARKLMAGGMPPETPVAAVRWGTRPEQATVRATLGTLADADVKAPSAIVVGRVAGMDLSWFESRPLFGVRIAVTRTREQASELVRMLQDLGAEVLEVPTIRIADPADWNPVDRAIREIEAYDWVVFASPNGVERFFGRMLSLGGDLRALKGVKVAAVGPATAGKVESYYVRVDLCPQRHLAEGIVEAFEKAGGVSGRRFLIPRPEVAREVLSEELRRMGGEVQEVVAYRTVKPEALPGDVLAEVDRGEVDLVTFTSSSTARHFSDLIGPEGVEAVSGRLLAASIGPVTSKTARDLGFRVVAEAPSDDISIPGLVRGIVDYFRNPAGGVSGRPEKSS